MTDFHEARFYEALADKRGSCARLDPAIPWHLSHYYPAYRMYEHPPTPVETLRLWIRI